MTAPHYTASCCDVELIRAFSTAWVCGTVASGGTAGLAGFTEAKSREKYREIRKPHSDTLIYRPGWRDIRDGHTPGNRWNMYTSHDIAAV